MKRWWLAIGICGVSVTLAAAVVPVCKRLTWHVPLAPRASKKLDHKPTPKTLAAWKAWDEAKTLREYDLACGPVATLDVVSDDLLTQPDLPPVAAVDVPEGLIAAVPLDEYEVASEAVPVAGGYPLPWLPVPGVYLPPVVADVPEPASFWLLLLGLPIVLLRKRAIPTYSQATK